MNSNKKLLFVLTISIIIAWGVVPALATLGELPAGTTTFFVNMFSAVTLAIMISVGVFDRFENYNKERQKDSWMTGWKLLKNYSTKRYLCMISLGLLWPFIYSLAYFHSIYIQQASLVVLLNFTWPLFYLIGLFVIYHKKFKPISFLGIFVSVMAAVYYVFVGNSPGELLSVMLILGGVVAITQGLYTAVTDGGWWSITNPGILTFVGACTATLFSIAFIMFFGELQYISRISFWSVAPLAFVGIFSNGLGFSAFLISNQLTSGTTVEKLKTKAVWLVSLSFIPFAQLLFLLLPFAELKEKVSVTSSSWIALSLLMCSFIILKLSSIYEEWKTHHSN